MHAMMKLTLSQIAIGAVAAKLPYVPVFTKGEVPANGNSPYVGMRIPALLLVPKGVPGAGLLAMCECGQPHFVGLVNTGCDICSKLSTDGGASWGPLVTVVKNSSQPAPVWDTVHKKLVLNFNGAPHCLDDSMGCGFNQQMISEDGGVTWGAPTPIDSFLGAGYDHAAAGPGVGLELTQGEHKGRLLFIGHRGPYVEDSVWYTDNGGKSYEVAKQKMPKMDEAQLVENANGTIIANMRWTGSPKEGRGISTSSDGGATFSPVTYDPMLKTAVCQATIFRSPQNGDIYFAGPSTSGRKDGTIRRSKTGLPSSWQPKELPVTNATYAYSCLSDVPQQGKAGLLWEKFDDGPVTIVFSTFDLEF